MSRRFPRDRPFPYEPKPPGGWISYEEWLERAQTDRDQNTIWILHERIARQHSLRDVSTREWIDLGGEA